MRQRIGFAIVFASITATLIGAAGFAAAPGAPGPEPEQALKMLLEGNARFVAGKMEHPNQTTARRSEISEHQHPFAAVLACSDSRSGPELVFDRGLGDLFIARVAGNVADRIVIESIDYSVKNLGVRMIMVLGHTHCGAVRAAIESREQHTSVGPTMRELRPAVEAVRKEPGDLLENAVRENVKLTVQKLSKSRELRTMTASGELKIVGGVLDLASGKVELLQTAAGDTAAPAE